MKTPLEDSVFCATYRTSKLNKFLPSGAACPKPVIISIIGSFLEAVDLS